MPIITISHQIGSGGREIGQAVAKSLGLDYVDREIVQGVAQQLGISEDEAVQMNEKAQSTVLRILSFISSGPQASYVPLDNATPMVDERQYFEATRKVIAGAAASNNVVIAGHGANFALQGRNGVLNIYIYAPKERRIATLVTRENIAQSQASQQVHDSDHDRAHYIKTFYGAEWHSPIHYHMMLNTGVVKPKLAVELIVQAAREGEI